MRELSCREVVEFLAGYLSHELSPPEREAFESHLAECDDCVVYIRQYEQAIRLSRDAYRVADELEEALPERLVDAILAARAKKSQG